MKKLTKTTALILSALMLFGCTSNSANGSIGDTIPPSESSVTDSKNESKTESSATENSFVTDNTSKENEENLVKNIEGYQTFSYDSSKYTITNDRIFFGLSFSPYDITASFEPSYKGISEFMKNRMTSPVAIKCHVVGDSYYFINGKCGDVQVIPPQDVPSEDMTFTPVMIDEIIDSYGFDTDYKQGDIIYINQPISIAQSYNGNTPLAWLDSLIEYMEYIYQSYVEDGNTEKMEIEKEDIEKYSAYRKYLIDNADSVVITGVMKLLEKNESYLAFADNTIKTYDSNNYVRAYGLYFDLANDEPDLHIDKESEVYFQNAKCYHYQWKYLKEKYGDHFKK